MAAGETEIERMVVRLIGDGKSHERMLKHAAQQTKTYTDKMGRLHSAATGKFLSGQAMQNAALLRTGRAFKTAGTAMRGWGRSLRMYVTLPLGIMAAVSVKAFANFDKAMIESTSIMKIVGDQADRMRAKALAMSMSGEALQGPKDLAKSYFFLASAGKDAEQSIALLPAVSRFATAGAFDMALATDLLTDAQSALGLATKNVAQDEENLIRVSDVLVKANTLANATVQQFSTALTSKAGAALKAFNKDVEEGVAVLAALADQGVKAELAGNSLGRMIRLLSKSSMDNAKQHQILGFRVFDTAGKMRNLGDIVANLENVLRGMTDQQKVATLAALGFEARVQAVILPLLGTSRAIKQYEKDLYRAGGITEEVAAKQMKAFANQMTVLKNQVTILAIEIGGTLAPALTVMAGYVKSGVKAWQSWSNTTKTAIVVLAGMVAVLGPLLIVLGFLASSIGSLITLFATLKTTMIATTLASWGLKASMLGVAAAAGVVAIAVGAFVIAARADLERLRTKADEAGEAFVRLADKRLKAIGPWNKAEGAKREKDVSLARERLKEIERVQKGSGGRSIGHDMYAALLGVGGAVGFDPAADARKELATVEAQLKKFQDAQKQAREVAKTAEGAARETKARGDLLAESERQAKVQEKIKQAKARVEEQTRSVIESLQMEIRTMRTSADAAQLWAMEHDGATKSAIRFTAELQKQRKALKEQEKAQREREQFMERGKRITEQFRDPLETFKARRAELTEMLRGGAVGPKTFARAMKGALGELGRSMITDVRKKAALPANIATRWGSTEMATSWKAHQRERAGIRDPQQERILVFLERIAVAIEAQTGVDIHLDAGALEAAGGRG